MQGILCCHEQCPAGVSMAEDAAAWMNLRHLSPRTLLSPYGYSHHVLWILYLLNFLLTWFQDFKTFLQLRTQQHRRSAFKRKCNSAISSVKEAALVIIIHPLQPIPLVPSSSSLSFSSTLPLSLFLPFHASHPTHSPFLLSFLSPFYFLNSSFLPSHPPILSMSVSTQHIQPSFHPPRNVM